LCQSNAPGNTDWEWVTNKTSKGRVKTVKKGGEAGMKKKKG